MLEIDDKLLKQAQVLTKAKTKKGVIHRSLEALIRQQGSSVSLENLAALLWI